MRKYIGPFTALWLAFVLTACASAIYQQPRVTLENVHIAGLGLRGGTLVVNLEVTNPNRFALNAEQLEYQVEISDRESAADSTWVDLTSGVYDEPFSVAAGATEMVEIPIEFSYSGLGGAASSLMRAGTFSYRATGTVDVRTPLGRYEVPFRRGGMVSLLSSR